MLKDVKDLSKALSNMEFEEGTLAKNTLLWDVLRDCMDGNIRAESNRLSQIIKSAQKERGIYNPVCRELTAAEILAIVGILLNEKEEGNG